MLMTSMEPSAEGEQKINEDIMCIVHWVLYMQSTWLLFRQPCFSTD